MRFVSPAGAPLNLGQILRALRTTLSSNGHPQKSLASLLEPLRFRYVFGASSGRAALWLILKSLKCLHPEREVVAIPAFTCFSVAASIVRAGLKIFPIDIDSQTLDFDFSQLDQISSEKLLCIVPCNLFGFLNDLPRIRRIAQAKGAFVLDDAAQALGGSRNGQLAGTGGDVGLYSLGRGKAVTTIEGGLIVTDSEEIARRIQQETNNLRASSSIHGAQLLLEMVVYSILLRPGLYAIPNSIPWLKLGTTEFEPDFATEALPPLCRALLPEVMDRLSEMNETRQTHAFAITKALATNSNFELPRPNSDCRPTFVRLPVIAHDSAARDRTVSQLRAAGIGASASYPSAICDIEGIESHMAVADFHRKQAELLSERLFTLPVHPFVSARDVEQMIAILNNSQIERF